MVAARWLGVAIAFGLFAVLYLSGGMFLAVGLPLLGVGLFYPKTVWARNEARLELTPVIGLGHAGGSARLRF